MDRWQIVCLSPIAWSAAWTSRHGLAAAWGRAGHRVLFVDPPQVVGSRKAGSPGPEAVGVTVVQPPRRLPYGRVKGVPVLGRLTVAAESSRYAAFVGRATRDWREDLEPLLLFNSFMPTLGRGVKDELRPDVTVYHRADEMEAFPQTDQIDLTSERLVVTASDVVVCVSEAVRAGIEDVRDDAVVVPNAVDADFFVDASVDPRLRDLPRPVVGLVGRIDSRNDPAYLRAAAEAAGTLVIVGPVFDIDLPRNSMSLGWCDRQELPGLLHGFDVGVLCYRRDYPGDALKTYEYLAAGIPVVTTDFAGLGHLRPDVTTAATPAEFEEAIRRAVDDRSVERDAARRAIAHRHSWTARAEELLGLAARARS